PPAPLRRGNLPAAGRLLPQPGQADGDSNDSDWRPWHPDDGSSRALSSHTAHPSGDDGRRQRYDVRTRNIPADVARNVPIQTSQNGNGAPGESPDAPCIGGALECYRKTRSAAASPAAMTSGMPTPRNMLPATANPGTRPTPDSMRTTRSKWPSVYCGLAFSQRNTRASTGSPSIPLISRNSSRSTSTSSSSVRCRISCSPDRPTNPRTRKWPSGARPAHLDDIHVSAFTF